MKKSISLVLISLILFSTFGILVLAKENDSGTLLDVSVNARTGYDSNDNEYNSESEVRIQSENEFSVRERNQLNEDEKRMIIRAENRLRINSDTPNNCTREGATLRCHFGNGSRIMTIYAGNSGNTIVQVKNTNASTKVELYKDDDGKVYGRFMNNETREIILPDEARERIEARLKVRLQNESLNLTEEGRYNIEARKRARLFFLFNVHENMDAEVDAETGAILRTRNSWWGFLARDVRTETQ